MSMLTSLTAFGLRQVLGDGIESVVDAVQQRFRDHSQTLPTALERAHDRTWQAFAVALAGDGFLDRVKVFFASGDDKGVREQVQLFLQSNAISFDRTSAEVRGICLKELKRLRKSGLLSGQNVPTAEVGQRACGFRLCTAPQGMIDEAHRAVAGVADALEDDYPNLARLLATPTPSGPPLLAVAFAYFFRREVDQALDAVVLELERIRQAAERARRAAEEAEHQARAGKAAAAAAEKEARAAHQAVLDLHDELARLAGNPQLNRDEVRRLIEDTIRQEFKAGMQGVSLHPRHSLSIRSAEERGFVKEMLARFRRLPEKERSQLPALLNALGILQAGIGDFEGARESFNQVAAEVSEDSAKAEASHNAYLAALERSDWTHALQAIQQAAMLDRLRFSPVPLGRYRPVRILGAGGFGTVFLCRDAFARDREVAVKALHTAELERSVDRVFGEAHALMALGRSHPAIIEVLDCTFDDVEGRQRPYIVMQYFPGDSLEKVIRERGPLPPEQLLEVARQVASGMKEAHARGVLHRDLTPENVLVRQEGPRWQAKVIDFGLALCRAAIETGQDRSSSARTRLTDSVAGTMKYAPPEQMGELPGVKSGPYSDVYASGKMCCYALFKTTQPTNRQWATVPKA
jgi:tetratricopeptide (TPR) repeat protein